MLEEGEEAAPSVPCWSRITSHADSNQKPLSNLIRRTYPRILSHIHDETTSG
jgi:hypothetical protein